MNFDKFSNKILFGAVVLLCLAATCERDTSVTVAGGAAPDFMLKGSGRLGYLQITGPKVREGDGIAAHTYWEIEPVAGYLNGTQLSRLSPIHYGQVPSGYRQKYPEGVQKAPSLVEGQMYTAVFDTTGANRATLNFTIRNGRAVVVTDASANANQPQH